MDTSFNKIDLIETSKLKWVSQGRDYVVGSLFGHILFLNTYFPDQWQKEFMKMLKYLHPQGFYEDAPDLQDNEKKRIRACFHGMQYILGLFDWDETRGAAIQPFPLCYDLETPNSEEEHKRITETFKTKVFPYLWYV